MKSHGTAQESTQSDERFMRLAIKEAARALGMTSPNPAVGAVIVKNGRLLSKGFHHSAGRPHAEIEAIRKLAPDKNHYSIDGTCHLASGATPHEATFGSLPRSSPGAWFSLKSSSLSGSTLYVTLEPCSSHGKTPPCTEAIIAAGISRVVYGATDPDKRHRGRAAKILRKAGIEVAEGILAEECAALNARWNHRNTTGLPWVIAKAGMSLDGHIDSPPHRRWITSAASRKAAMLLRASVEAILVGGGTVRTDDPALTIRGIKLAKNHPQPWRVVWSRSGKLPKKSKLLTDKHRDRTIVLDGISLQSALKELGKRGISSVLIEGGGHTLGEAFRRKLVDEIRFFIAPVIQGGNVPAVSGDISPARLTEVTYNKIGSDVMILGKVPRKQKSGLR